MLKTFVIGLFHSPGNYSGVYGQMPTAVHHPNPSLGGIEGAASYAGAPTPQEFQSFNMPGIEQCW